MVLALSLLLIIVQFAFLVIVAIGTATVLAGAISITLDVPYVPTPSRYYRIIEKALQIKARDTMYELGSGTGGLLLALAKKHPDTAFIGIELNPLLFYFSRVRKRLVGNPTNVVFRRENFFNTDFSRASKVYGYLLDTVMPRLLEKLQRESHGLRFASRAFKFESKEPAETITLSRIPGSHGEHMVYVYEL